MAAASFRATRSSAVSHELSRAPDDFARELEFLRCEPRGPWSDVRAPWTQARDAASCPSPVSRPGGAHGGTQGPRMCVRIVVKTI